MGGLAFAVHQGAGPAPTLYEISERLALLTEALDIEQNPAIRDDLESELRATVEAELRKVDNVARFLAHLEQQQRFAAAEIARLEERKATFERYGDRLEGYVVTVMRSFGAKVLEGRTATLLLRNCPASVEVTDYNAVPDEYRRVKETWTVDKRRVKDAIEAGVVVPGARLITDKQTLIRR